MAHQRRYPRRRTPKSQIVRVVYSGNVTGYADVWFLKAGERSPLISKITKSS